MREIRRNITRYARGVHREIAKEKRVVDFKKADAATEERKKWIENQGMKPGVRIININDGQTYVIKEVTDIYVLVLRGHEKVFRGKKQTYSPLIFRARNSAAE